MGILDILKGQYGSLAQASKQGGQQMGLLQQLGLGQTPGINPGANPADQQMQDMSGGLAALGQRLGTWGAGVSAASGPSRLPVDFGQALAGGTQALQAEDDRMLDKQVKEAQIGKFQAQSQPDFEQSAQQALIKRNMGLELSPQEEATLKAFDAFNMTKQSASTDQFGNVRMMPRASILGPQGMPQSPQGGGQNPDPRRRLQELEAMRNAAGVR